MCRNIRDRRIPNRRVVHITNRCWKGLPFVPNRTIKRSLEGVLAKAQTMYRIEIVCYLFMGNHYHMILAGNATRVSAFANYVDGEIAKRMMRFFPNRWGPQFWVDRFKEELLPNVDSVVNKIAYVFCNPLRARLVSKLSTYPGACSFNSISSLDNRTSALCSFTFPRFFKQLKDRYLTRRKDLELAKELHRHSEGFLELKTNLFGWVHCFAEKRAKKYVLENLNGVISEAEAEAARLGVIGARKLINQPLDKLYRPKKSKRDRSPFVDCPDPDLRKRCIQEYQEFKAECRAAWELVKVGLEAVWPYGAFIPGRAWRQLAPLRPS